ncbi:hypothetical protein AVEN_18139-1 [Araneus ventricosus]|uniref:Reverse transcriptase domain-containing protein n=1 Tax=Araneus ventricosus TaxID=182803 RepID=A0A4Y2AIW6_ARAVE|nr:hypothetical protein AVEN_18139-1 [Araneus ventricosus]
MFYGSCGGRTEIPTTQSLIDIVGSVVFGISCNPFLLAAVLNHVLDQVEEPLRSLATKLKDSLYVDNCVASVDSVSVLAHFRTETQRILKTAKFDLRGWKNNFRPEIEELSKIVQVP